MGTGVSKQSHYVISLDFEQVRQLARAADFFYTYPRITQTYLGRKSNVFSLSGEYKRAVTFLSLPYLLTGVILVLAAIIFNLYRYFRKGISPGADDTKDSDPGQRDRTAKAYLLFSAFLHVSILLLIGMAFGANVTIREAVESGSHALTTLQDKVDVELLVPSTFLAKYAEIILRQPPVPGIQGYGQKRLAFDFMSIYESTFVKTRAASKEVVDSLGALNDYLASISNQMFYGITMILLLFVVGSFLMFFGDVAPPRAHKTRMVMIILFALPLGAAWGLVAFSTVMGVAAGDFCYSLQKYHRIVAGQKSSLLQGSTPPIPEYNFFLESNLQCPTQTAFRNEFNEMNKFFDQAANADTFNFGVAFYDKDHDHVHWAEAMRWAEEELSAYGECAENARFGGMLAYHMCGDHNASTVSAMALMWLASAGLSMLFGVLVFISSLGQPPAEYATGYEMLQLYGAPKLIRAFGDVGNALTRQATFHRIASMDGLSTDGREQGKLHVTKSVAEAFTDCAIPVEDNYLVHIQSSRRSTSKRSKSGKLFSLPSTRRPTLDSPDPDVEQPTTPAPLRKRRSSEE